ncbi:ABC transporter permease [Vogesella oryzae]|uniref:ABC transporter permease n=1 Tax=Vogesella oryzae TaxID=1735285 RepID=UPI00158417FE|nr:ABC transporter permease [Vogesella oryzae]
MEFDVNIIVTTFPLYLRGLGTTLQLVAIALACGMLLALPLGVIRAMEYPWLGRMVGAYTYFFRSTPMLVQLLMVYYGFGQFKWLQAQWDAENRFWLLFREPYFCACLAFSLNTAAYTAEIIAGAIRNSPVGEIEAAKAMGMSWSLRMRRIILPGAFRRMMQSYSNEVILMLQGSAIASAVTLNDLTGAGRTVYARFYAPFEAFVFTGLMYLLLTFIVLGLFKLAERKWLAHLRPRGA